jgi:SAM-dependent methyltransferase
MKKIQNAIFFMQEHGIRSFVHELIYRVTINYYERHLGVDTCGYIESVDLGFTNHEFNSYEAIGYKVIYSMLERLPLDKSKSTFLDYGCGKGRAIVVAATFPFKRVIGLEISAPLLAVAEININKMRYKRAESIELYQADATQYVVPKDVNVIYFYNPFQGHVLREVLYNIYDSYKHNPREIYILFFNNDHFEKVIANQNWITRIYKTSFYIPRFPSVTSTRSCGLYVTKVL